MVKIDEKDSFYFQEFLYCKYCIDYYAYLKNKIDENDDISMDKLKNRKPILIDGSKSIKISTLSEH